MKSYLQGIHYNLIFCKSIKHLNTKDTYSISWIHSLSKEPLGYMVVGSCTRLIRRSGLRLLSTAWLVLEVCTGVRAIAEKAAYEVWSSIAGRRVHNGNCIISMPIYQDRLCVCSKLSPLFSQILMSIRWGAGEFWFISQYRLLVRVECYFFMLFMI